MILCCKNIFIYNISNRKQIKIKHCDGLNYKKWRNDYFEYNEANANRNYRTNRKIESMLKGGGSTNHIFSSFIWEVDGVVLLSEYMIRI